MLDLKDSLEALAWDDEAIRFTLYAPGGQAASPHFLLDAVLEDGTTTRSRQIPVHKTGFVTAAARAP